VKALFENLKELKIKFYS